MIPRKSGGQHELIGTTDSHLSLLLFGIWEMEFPLDLIVARVTFVMTGLIWSCVGQEELYIIKG